MRFPMRWYLVGVCVLVLVETPASGQTARAHRMGPEMLTTGSNSGPEGHGHLRCGSIDAAMVQIQGEARPRLPVSYQTNHFIIYYTNDPSSPHAPPLDDTDQNGVPVYIEHLGLYFEQAWTVYSTPTPEGMGYNTPPLHPGARYPVVVYSLPSGYSGQTWPDNKSGRRSTSHISMDAHLYDPYARHVAAHELFHAFQFGYNYVASQWWKEASADWASSEVFPEADTYTIPYYDWFQVPGWPLNYADGWHEYGSSIWARHLAETRGRDIIRTIWMNQRTENDSLKAIERALESTGITLADQFRDFAAWNWFTGDRADGAHYKYGHIYPQIAADDHSASTLPPFNGTIQQLGSAYLALVPGEAGVMDARRPSPGLAIQSLAGARGPKARLKAQELVVAPTARGLTLRLKSEDGLAAQLILEQKDGTRATIAVAGDRFHVPGFEQSLRRVILVLCNGDTARRHAFSGSVSLGIVYRDQYGYVWDLDVSPDGKVHGTVEVGDQQPWPVSGTIQSGGFHWRAINPDIQKGERWATGFDVSSSSPVPTDAHVRWTNDAGRSDVWTGAVVNGSFPKLALTNRRGPALP